MSCEGDVVVVAEAPSSGLAAFAQGAAAPWRGLAYLRRRPELWREVAVLFLLNLLLTGVVLALFVAGVVVLATALHPYFPATWGGILVQVLAALTLLVLALLAALAVGRFLQGVVCGLFYQRLARRVAEELGMRRGEPRESSWPELVGDSARSAGVMLAVNVGCLGLHAVPVLGSLAALAVGLWWNCRELGREQFDYPLALHGRGRRERRAFTRRHRGQTLGLGATVLAFNLVPVVSSLLLPGAVVGAVLLRRRLTAEEAEGA
jgi:uncharacterized protein involved in cysteine biosynthesis